MVSLTQNVTNPLNTHYNIGQSGFISPHKLISLHIEINLELKKFLWANNLLK